ncbi:hypothetical protein DRQ50_12240 [bacterium]|nr:MAG: hypothetical protein DRQ50_12240 [bacterium]
MGDRTDFMLQVGYDWYADAKLHGHDTAYLPTGDHVNPRDGYDYGTANDVIDQPANELLLMMGLRIRL